MLVLHRSERADALAAGLADVLREPIAGTDPLVPEVVAVPARGVERWLTQRLSHRLGASEDSSAPGGDGVCANIDFPWPSTLVARAVAAAVDVDPDNDAWRPGRAVWTVLEVVDAAAGQPWLAALHRHLDPTGPAGARRRFVAARHVAVLFDSYAAQRPAMLRDWLAGADTDGLGELLPADLRWQAELWRRLRAVVDAPSPAERLDECCAALRADTGVVDLPARLSVFGPTRLSTDQLSVLGALAEHREVHLWLPHPSPALWNAVQSTLPDSAASDDRARSRRRVDPTAELARHPLLRSLGREVREMQPVLADIPATRVVHQHHRLADPPNTLLGRLQRDLRVDRTPVGGPIGDSSDQRSILAPDDRSLQVHAAHGRARQVEVLREVLLGLLAGDATLEPRDVLVMCPDIETYAPLVSATFGLAVSAEAGTELDTRTDQTSHPGHRLRVRLADRSLRQTNPLLAVVGSLLELADARVTAAQVLDLAALAPVRRRFRLDDQDLERLRDWVAESGVRWGLDATHRAPFNLQGVPQNTWRAGLDRILLGVAMAEDDDLRWLGLALPLDDVDSLDVDLAGRLAELVDRLAVALDRLLPDQPLHDWLSAVAESLDLLTDVPDHDAWQRTQALRQLADVAAEAGERSATVCSLGDVRAVLADRLRGRPTRAGFRTGNLTMCSMVPMRSVPHRVVCLLGLDDGVFPRSAGTDGDDVLARDPLVGERDRRSEDRQLLLDAVLAATEHLVIVYTGADERTNVVRPPAVPVGEILDVVDQTVRTSTGKPGREQVVVRHPLQPFDARNFVPRALGSAEPFSFDTAALAGARAAARERRRPTPFLSARLAPIGTDGVVPLDGLAYLLEHPVRAFLRRRLEVLVPEEGDELAEDLVTELDGLSKWAIGERWLGARLAGADADSCREAEWRRGTLPPGALGRRALATVEAVAEPLVATVEPMRQPSAGSYDVTVALPDGGAVAGTVGGVYGQCLVRAVYSRLGAKHRIRAWAQLLALTAGRPESAWQAVTIGRGHDGAARSTLRAPVADEADRILAELADIYRAGLREPLPLPVQPAEAYAKARRLGVAEAGARIAAGKRWTGSFDGDRDRHHVRVWGANAAVNVFVGEPASADEQPRGGNEPTRFGALACRTWWPLLDVETLDAP